MRSCVVLVVDDDPVICDMLTEYINREPGFKAVSASKVTEAITKLEVQKFDCVLLDMRFEYRSGEQVIETMRAEHARNLTTPIIVISGFLDAALVLRVRKSVKSILVKPFQNSVMMARIREAVEAPSAGAST
ncbi:MAG: response regulator [Oligoflexia bacterium]|nr:response regulator [Oligoflexia bacterium]